MNTGTQKIGKRRLLLLLAVSFLVAFLCLNLAFLSRGISLFGGAGNKSILISDMHKQYIDFFAALRNGDVFYTGGLGLSGDFTGTFAYYLSSPFSLIIFLFQKEQLQTALLLILFLKVSLAASSFCGMLFRYQERAGVSAVFFSLCYALMSFVFYFFINIFWLDAMILLPLLAAAVERLAETGTAKYLPPLLGLLFFSNFYISYITGLFLALFFLFLAAAKKLPVKEVLLRGLKLLGAAAFGAALAAVLLLPTVRSYLKSAGQEAFNGYGALNFTPKQFLLKLFGGYYDSIGNAAGPTVFCGVLVLILVFCYFLNQKIPVREKCAAGGLTALMLISFLFPQLDRVWHGFSYPNAFAYRYAFCFCFFAVLLAARSYRLRDGIPKFALFLCFLPAALILSAARYLLTYYLTPLSLAMTFLGFLLYPSILLLERSRRFAPAALKISPLLLAVLVPLELLLNGAGILAGIGGGYPFPLGETWIAENGAKSDMLRRAGYDSLSRAADTDPESSNEGAALGYKGFSVFSSDYNPALQRLFQKLGYDGSYKGCGYLAGNPTADSLFGVEYIFSKVPLGEYAVIDESFGIYLHRNAAALPAAYAVSGEVRDFEFSGENPAENTRALLNAMLPEIHADEQEQLAALATQSLTTEQWENGKLAGSVTAKKDGLLFTTLPYDSNYTVLIDGKKTGTFTVLGVLLAAELPAGTHTVEIVYRPLQLFIGFGVSLVAAGIWLFTAMRKKPATRPARILRKGHDVG